MAIRVSAQYPVAAGGRFDFDYFATQHVPLVFRLLSAHGCRKIEVDRPLASRDGKPATYAAVGHMEFDSLEGFDRGFAACGEEILADVPNYTDVSPVVAVSEITTVLN
jgi:uncharacterized protein (TIGR02118 family)